MPFKKSFKRRNGPYRKKFRKRYPKKNLVHLFEIKRWSKIDTGEFRMADQLTPGGPLVYPWLVGTDGNYKMNFIFKTFSLIDVPRPEEFTNLFNWYAIKAVKVCLTFSWSHPDLPSFTSPPTAPALYDYKPSQSFVVCSFIDKTGRIDWSNTAPTYIQNSESEAKQYSSYRQHIAYNKNFKRMVHPKPLGVIEVDESGTMGLGGQSMMKWISTRSTSTPHYGMVIGVRPVYAPAQTSSNKWRVSFSIDCQYTLVMKGTR